MIENGTYTNMKLKLIPFILLGYLICTPIISISQVSERYLAGIYNASDRDELPDGFSKFHVSIHENGTISCMLYKGMVGGGSKVYYINGKYYLKGNYLTILTNYNTYNNKDVVYLELIKTQCRYIWMSFRGKTIKLKKRFDQSSGCPFFE